jgi:hypothetical protein
VTATDGQTTGERTWLEYAALGAFVASWRMPWLDGVNGWLIFRAAMNPIVPYTGDSRVVPLELPEHLMYFLGSLTVFVFVGVFWAVEVVARRGLKIALDVAVLCLLINLYTLAKWSVDGTVGYLRGGYYASLLSWAFLATGAWYRQRRFEDS